VVTVSSPLAPTQKGQDAHALGVVADGLMTIEEAAGFLAISRGHVYSLMNEGALRFVKLGRSRRIPRRSVVELAARALQGGVFR